MVGQVAGDLIGAAGSYSAGRYNRKAAYASATAAEQQGSDQAQIIQRQARAAIGAQSAAQGESGFQQGSGSALDAIAQSQVNATLDAMTARTNAENLARQRRQQGDIAYAAGKNGMVSGLIKAGNDAVAAVAGAPGAGGSAPATSTYQPVDWASSGPGGSATPASSSFALSNYNYNSLGG